MRNVVWLGLVAGCQKVGGTDPIDTGSADTDTDTDTDTDADTDADADSDADTDTGPPAPVVEIVRIGTAVVDGSYDGVEEIQVVDDDGAGDVVCQVTVDLDSVGDRTDCPNCQWAYDVQVSNAAVLLDEGACLAALGVDATTIATLNGQTTGYGFNPDYFGHAEVLVTDVLGYWAVATYATWDEPTKTFTYEWED